MSEDSITKKKQHITAIGFLCCFILSGCQNTNKVEAKEIESISLQENPHTAPKNIVEKQVSKQKFKVSCDAISFNTVYWKALDQDVKLITNSTIDDKSQARIAGFHLKLTNGTSLNLGNTSFEEANASNSDCTESLIVAADSILKSLSGQRELSDQNIYFNNYSELYDYNAVALECQQPSTPTFHPPVAYENQTQSCKAAIDHWNIYAEYGRQSNRHSKWTNQRNQDLVRQKAPVVYVTRSKTCTDILVYDPIDRIMRLVMPTRLKCIDRSE